jgi:peroxiredoxin
MKRSGFVIVMLMAFVGATWAQDLEKRPSVTSQPEPARVPLTPTGTVPGADADLTPGDKAPDFQLDSSRGGTVRLADLKGHWAVLVFDESRSRLAPLAAVQDSIRALGAQPFGVCQDGVGALKTFAEREKIGFPLLSDLTGEISQLFGMYDDASRAIQAGLVIVDAQGVIRMIIQGPSLHADDVLQMVGHVIRGT